MIDGFEEITRPLSDKELSWVPTLVKSFNTHVGSKHAVTNKLIIERLGLPKSWDVRIRIIVHHIRIRHLVKDLIATIRGYYVEPDQEKVKAYVKSLHQRIESIAEIANSYGHQQIKIKYE